MSVREAARVFRLPDLGEGLTEAELVTWLVAVGDEIAIDQAIAEVETAKSVVELPSPFAGIVTALHGTPGHTIDVGAPVLEVGGSTDAAPAEDAPVAPAPGPDDAALEDYREQERAGSGGSGNVLIGYGTTAHGSPQRRRRAPADRPAPAPTAPRASAPARAERTSDGPTPVRSPVVRRLARDLGVDVRTLAGTGARGEVTKADVVRAASPEASTAPVSEPPGLQVAARERMSMLRRTVSETLSRSRREIPDATVWVDVDATALWEVRAQLAGPERPAPSLTAFLARFVLIALERYPLLASRVDGDELVRYDGVNLGIAADTERGLMVPSILRADTLSLDELDATLREVAADARSGALPPERLRGSTFTLNNYGAFEVDGSSAIINHPEVAILGVGRMIPRPWVVDGQLVPRRIAQLSLVFDHRVCDGGYAASFLRTVKNAMENPVELLRRI